MRDIRSALSQVPSTLGETYTTILSDIPSDDRPISREILKWLTFARAGFLLQELTEAVVLTNDHPILDPDARLIECRSLLQPLRSLIRFEAGTQTVGLAHESVRAFLVGKSIKQSSAADFYLGEKREGGCAVVRQKEAVASK